MEGQAAPQGRLELADLFRTHGQELHGLSSQQCKVATAILRCRTAALGGHARECENGCGYEEIAYNSCRDRHCPKCGTLERMRWQEARGQDLLPVPYYHLVFTIPSSLHDIFLAHQKVAYRLLFAAAADTLKEVAANPKNLGALIGMTAVLHTWTQTLLYHPHLHFIVPGGGLDPTGTRWIPSGENFFLSVDILSIVFRGKLLDALQKAEASGQIRASTRTGVPVARLLKDAARHKWGVFAKRPFAGPEQVLAYLGRYTQRIALSNERLVSTQDNQVTFCYRDRADGNRLKHMTLDTPVFLRRFLLHVLPPGFARIRHYGFLANSVRRHRIPLCRQLLGPQAQPPPPAASPTETWQEMMLRLTGEDVTLCPRCHKGHLRLTATLPRTGHAPGPIHLRGPPP
jgi:hypothetical protein